MLEVKNVNKGFFSKKVLSDLNMKIEKGHIYGLLGPNGSGKTTFMKSVVGLVKFEKGEILLGAEPISYKTNAKIAYMPTEPYFYEYMTVESLGKYYKTFYEDFDAEEYKKNLEFMELDMKLKTKTLSSGMAAKLKLAVTLARNSKLFMLDEPLNGIDLIARDRILDRILAKSSSDNAIIVSSHLVEELERISDRVMFLKDGKIVLEGDMDTLRQQTGKSISDVYRDIYGLGEIPNVGGEQI